MLAGPSECLVICDETADGDVVAADLLAQAEHDSDALPVLVSTSEATIQRVNDALRRQLPLLPEPNRSTATQSVQKGWAVMAKNLTHAAELSNLVGPEHLELQVREDEDKGDGRRGVKR